MKAAAVFARVLFCLAFVAGGAVAPAVALTAEELAELKQKAEQGDAEAQFKLGTKYTFGKDVGKDEAEGVKWFRLAAKQGHAKGQDWLGYAYRAGRGIEKDGREAVKWYRLASDQGNKDSSYDLGLMYFNGEGVEKEETEGVKWFRRALKQGRDDAQFMLAKAYEEGRGVEKDEAEAVKRYRLAAEQNSEAQYRLGLMYEEGRGVERDEVEMIKWYYRAAQKGNEAAREKMVYLFRLAAENGDAYAQYLLGWAYDNGFGVEENKTEAVKWYHLAAEQGHMRSQFILGKKYSRGEGVEENEAVAHKWDLLAAKQGHPEAAGSVGARYDKFFLIYRGVVVQDQDKAAYWYRIAIDRGNVSPLFSQAINYRDGDGVPQSEREYYILLLLAGIFQGNEVIVSVIARYKEAARHYDRVAKIVNSESVEAEVRRRQAKIQKMQEQWKKQTEEEYSESAVLTILPRVKAQEVVVSRRKGDAYYKGKGVLPNYKEAAKWYRQAAERGDAEAQYRLGLMYAEGKRGVEQNHVEAYIWLALAGVNDTGEIGDKAASLRESVEKSLTAEQFEQAQAEATERLEKIKAKQ